MSELRKDSLSFPEAVGQSIAAISPTFTPAIGVAVVGGMAGTASWLVFVVATIMMIVVGLNIARLAKRIPAAGASFLYVSRTLGPSAGLPTAWAMMLGYLFTSIALVVATAMFFQDFLTGIGVSLVIPNVVLFLVVGVAVWFFAYRDIKMSSQLALALEAVSVVLIIAVCFVIWDHYGFAMDPKQIHLEGATLGGAGPAIVFAIFSFVGFESCTTLGKETRNAGNILPKVVLATAIFAGIFFVFTTFVTVIGFADDADKLGASAKPLSDISSGITATVATLVYIGATISCFACALAHLNAFGRMLFSLGRYQFVHKSMGFVHTEHRTPHLALTLGAVTGFIIAAVFSKQAETDLIGYFGTIATFGFIFNYLLCSVCAPILLRRQNILTAFDVLLGVVGAICMVLAFVGSVYPVPDYPYNYFPYGFVVYMIVGVLWLMVLRNKMPQVLMSIEHDLESTAASPPPAKGPRQATA
jgi:amino acid transporter